MTTTASSVSGVPISALADAGTLDGTELVPIVKDGVTERTTTGAVGGISGAAVIWSAVAVAALAAGANNNLLVDISTVARLALTPADSTSELNGLQGGVDGKMLWLINRSTVDFFTVFTEAAGSLAANRFAINGDLIIPARCGALFIYDGTLARWVKS